MIEIIKLLGFTLGASIHTALLFILWRSRQATARTRRMMWAILSSTVWHLGNSLRLMFVVLGGSPRDRVGQVFDLIAFTGLAWLPALLVHAHLEFHADYEKGLKGRPWYRPVLWTLYAPLIVWPWLLRRLWGSPESTALEKLNPYLTLLAVGFAGALAVCGVIDYR